MPTHTRRIRRKQRGGANTDYWLAVETGYPEDGDIHHKLLIFKTEEEANEANRENDGDEILSFNIEKVSVPSEVRDIYVVYHYHDNYADVITGFSNKAEEYAEFKKRVQEMPFEMSENEVLRSETRVDSCALTHLWNRMNPFHPILFVSFRFATAPIQASQPHPLFLQEPLHSQQ